jgi:hypothetical protein
VTENAHDRVQFGTALGELCSDCVPKAMRRDGWSSVGSDKASSLAGFLER